MQIPAIFNLIPPYLNVLISENTLNLVINIKIMREFTIAILELFFNNYIYCSLQNYSKIF
jgi:hypothetical protein